MCKVYLSAGYMFFFLVCLCGQGKVYWEGNRELAVSVPLSELQYRQGTEAFLLFSFATLPSEEEKKELSRYGITLTGYLPENSWLAVVRLPLYHRQTEAFRETQIYGKITGFAELPVTYKIHSALQAPVKPYWIYTGPGTIRVHVSVFSGIDEEALEKTGAVIHAMLPGIRLAEVDIAEDRLSMLAALPFVSFIQPAPLPGEPESEQSRTLQRGNCLDTDDGMGLQLDGSGIKLAINDDGDIGPHIDFEGRVDQSEVNDTFPANDHGDHVAGIIMGAGNKNPRYRGMATGADLKVYAYTSDFNSNKGLFAFPNAYLNENIVVTSTSYSDGCNTGYTSFAQLMDQQISTYTGLMHVFSSGNSGASNCGYGAGAGWGNITGGHKAAKNCLTIGNVNNQDALASNSSRGPVHDGRIKPELVAAGGSVISTTSNPPHDYTSYSGTSMACPAVAGVLAQLYQLYASLNGGNTAPSALIKAAAMNTADDLGNPGPDFRHGYGRINARRAADLIAQNRYMQGTVSNGGSTSFTITIPSGARELRVMLYWHDPPATAGANVALVNNLNLSVTDPLNVTWLPWILDATASPASLNANASRGIDNRNNAEQVTITNPAAGNHTLQINGVSVPAGPQVFYVVYEILTDEVHLTYPAGGESFVPGETERIRWDAYGNTSSFTLDYTTNGGSSWTTIATLLPAAQRYFDWTVPNMVTGELRVRLQTLVLADTSRECHIIGVPVNLTVDTVCGSQVVISWNPVAGAQSYVVSLLGQKYMNTVDTVTATMYKFSGINTTVEHWFSVRALGSSDASGRRAIAVRQAPGSLNCAINHDIEVNRIDFPFNGSLPDCALSGPMPVKVTLINRGLSPASSFQVKYSVNNSPEVIQNVVSAIAPGDTHQFTFFTPVTFPSAGSYVTKVWVSFPSDQFQFNDTLFSLLNVFPGTLAAYPMQQDFENFSLCATTANCNNTQCNLSDGFVNQANIQYDDIDWRTSFGTTPSPATGPSMDYNPGTITGKYLYLEASNCVNQYADLYLPCVDLTTASTPYMKFAYSMVGDSIGTLSVDVFQNGGWQNLFQAEGKQYPQWKTAILDLSGYVSQVLLFRFRGTTANGPTGDLAIDDISISEAIADIEVIGDTAVCADSAITFIDNSVGTITTWDWDFGPDAIPTVASGPGPHAVVFTSTGTKRVSLLVNGPGGTHTGFRDVFVNDQPPVAAFTFSLMPPDVYFDNLSQNGLIYKWFFGDGDSSVDEEPVHLYANDGQYYVTLIVGNGCGWDTLHDSILIVGLNTEPQQPQIQVKVFPNPFTDRITLSVSEHWQQPVDIEIRDMSGRMVFRRRWEQIPSNFLEIHPGPQPSGVYLLSVRSDEQIFRFKIIKSPDE